MNNNNLFYKFVSSDKFDRILDIILNKRLYCADWTKFNDINEGSFYSLYDTKDKNVEETIQKIKNEKNNYKICCLSTTYKSYILWAHYANSFKGVAFELELIQDQNFSKVSYKKDYPLINLLDNQNLQPKEIAKKILAVKHKDWNYEKEVRIFSKKEWYFINNSIKKVIVGPRIEEPLLEVLKIICKQKNLPLFKFEIDKLGPKIQNIDLK